MGRLMEELLVGEAQATWETLDARGVTPADLANFRANPKLQVSICRALRGLPSHVEAEGVERNHIITVRRGRKGKFNPVVALCPGWKIIEEDPKALAMRVVGFADLRLETNLEPGENSITGEEKLARIRKVGQTSVDAGFLDQLIDEPGQTTLNRLRAEHGVNRAYAFGTILESPDGRRRVFYAYWGGRCWVRDARRLECSWGAGSPSLVLARPNAERSDGGQGSA